MEYQSIIAIGPGDGSLQILLHASAGAFAKVRLKGEDLVLVKSGFSI